MIISCGNIFTKDAKLAPAPIKTNKAGKAQQIKVDDDANRDKKFADLSSIVFINPKQSYQLHFDH